MTPELFAAHHTLAQVMKGQTFRDAYASATWKHAPSLGEIIAILKQSTHTGGTGNLGLSALQKELVAEHALCLNTITQFTTAMARLRVSA